MFKHLFCCTSATRSTNAIGDSPPLPAPAEPVGAQTTPRNATAPARIRSPQQHRLLRHQAHIAALQNAIAPRDRHEEARCYFNLGAALAPREKARVRIDGRAVAMENTDCYVAALTRDANHAEAFYRIGNTLDKYQYIEFAPYGAPHQPFNQKKCYLAALAITPDVAKLYVALGEMLGQNDTVRVDNVDLTQVACFQKALELGGLDQAATHRVHEELARLNNP